MTFFVTSLWLLIALLRSEFKSWDVWLFWPVFPNRYVWLERRAYCSSVLLFGLVPWSLFCTTCFFLPERLYVEPSGLPNLLELLRICLTNSFLTIFGCDEA